MTLSVGQHLAADCPSSSLLSTSFTLTQVTPRMFSALDGDQPASNTPASNITAPAARSRYFQRAAGMAQHISGRGPDQRLRHRRNSPPDDGQPTDFAELLRNDAGTFEPDCLFVQDRPAFRVSAKLVSTTRMRARYRRSAHHHQYPAGAIFSYSALGRFVPVSLQAQQSGKLTFLE